MMWGYGINPGWVWLYGLLAMASLLVVIVWAVRALRNDAGPGGAVGGDNGPGDSARGGAGPDGAARSDARRILDDRFARGELTAEQYRAQVAELPDQP